MIDIKNHTNTKLFTVNIYLRNSTLQVKTLESAFKYLENETNKINIKKLKIERSDIIFNYINTTEFKNSGNKIIQKLKIAILPTRINLSSDDSINELIQNYHLSHLGGHVGINRVMDKILEKYTFKNMKSRIRKIISACLDCKKNKSSKFIKEKMQITDTPNTSFEVIAIDTVGPFHRASNNNRYVLTIIDELTKYVILKPIPNKESSTIAKAFVESFILKYGAVQKIKSDCGSEYVNSLFDDINKLLGIRHSHSTPHRPQTIGSLERNHKNLNEFLRIYVNKHLNDWDQWIAYYEFCYNTTPCVATGYTPFELVYGKKANLPIDLCSDTIDPLYNLDDYSKEVKFKLQVAHRRAGETLLKQKLLRKESHDLQVTTNSLKIGEKVMLKSFGQTKLEPIKQGPYIVVDLDASNANIQQIDLNTGKPTGKIKTVHKNNLSIC